MKIFNLISLSFTIIQAVSGLTSYMCSAEPSTTVGIQKLATPGLPFKIIQKCARNEHLILPPVQIELPQGLGYLPAAVPYVASCFEPAVVVQSKCSGASIPVASANSRLTLAAPISPDWAPLVRPVNL